MVQQCGEPHLPVLFRCLSHTVQPVCLTFPALRLAQVRLDRVLLGQRPSLRSFLRPSQVFVRLLRRYYAAARLPTSVHPGLMAHRFLPAVRSLLAADGDGVSRFSCVKFLCMRGVFDSAGPSVCSRCLRTRPFCLPVWPTPSTP